MASLERGKGRGGLAGPPTRRERMKHLVYREADLDLAWLREQERALAAWSDEAAQSRDPDRDLLARLAAHQRWLADEIRRLGDC